MDLIKVNVGDVVTKKYWNGQTYTVSRVEGNDAYLPLDGREYHYAAESHDWIIVKRASEVSQRFMTAWVYGEGNDYREDGHTFTSLKDAEDHARAQVSADPTYKMAVFEIRSIHSSKIEVTSEAA